MEKEWSEELRRKPEEEMRHEGGGLANEMMREGRDGWYSGVPKSLTPEGIEKLGRIYSKSGIIPKYQMTRGNG
ncbi:hypothetical protein Pmani_040255 [Petrolisthes manimaculis]|uniref:Uncharacterized protein n=1 Tax=Petrolisthes manimaculis TaxID=1843537 RepID=A0AAE1TIL2_9EUCA|nr:hypothetical protein Pmani_040255 [Petrolisthes manimaculis]